MNEVAEIVDAKITERTIRDRMVRSVFSPYTDLLAFNLCGLGRYTHEMDLVRIMRSGWMYEFEIKISAADIRADVTKKPEKYDELQNGVEVRLKTFYDEDIDLSTIERVPNQVSDPYIVKRAGRATVANARIAHPVKEFTVVVPTDKLGEIAVSTLPSWVGVVVLDRFWKVVRAPSKLPNGRKLTDAERMDVLNRLSCRFWNMYLDRGGKGRK